MFVSDAHCDTLYQLAIKGLPAARCCVTRDRLAKGGVGVQTFAVYTSMERPDPWADALIMKETYKQLPVTRLDAPLPELPPSVPCGVLSAEGGEMFKGSLELFRDFDDDVHLRLIALTWNYENEIGMPAYLNDDAPLKPFGRELLREMDARGVAADVSHLNIGGFWDVIEHAAVPPVASHSNPRWLCDVKRNLNRDQVRALIDRNGYIGVNFYSGFLASGRPATIEDVVNCIDEICQMGGAGIVGFGSDFDGIDAWPEGLASPADFPRLIEALRGRGYGENALADIAGLNYWRFLRRAEACAASHNNK